ncbi:lysophospholipid acyltransferase, partial [Pancytospora epiphaga]
TNKTEKKQLPLKQSLKTLLFLSIYLRFNKYPFKSLILSEDTPLPTRLVLLYLYNVVLRTKFHFIWNFSHCCYILYGRDEFLNIDFFKVEFTESVREISSNWNRFVTRWLKEMFFIKLKSTSMSPTMAAIVTHLISASLHGLNACYLVFFMSLGTFSKLITRINGLIPVKFIRQFQMVWFITFFSMPFYLLNLKETYLIWKAVYFYGLVYCIGMSLLFASYDFIRTRKVSIISKAPQMEIYVKNK